jgi:hypothetical protein
MANNIVIPPAPPAPAEPAPIVPTPSPAVAPPAVPAIAPAPSAVPAVPASAAVPAAPETDPQWLAKRLERERTNERTKFLKSMGFESEEAAKKAATDLAANEEAKKSTEQRALEATQRANAAVAEQARLLKPITEYAARMMVGLTPDQQTVVKQLAGDDPAKQLETITALAPTWASAIAPAAPAVPAPAAVPALPATTAPAATAPSGNTPAPADPRGVYEQTRKLNPFEAAAFGGREPSVYVPKPTP